MRSNDWEGAIVFGPAIRRVPPRRQRPWATIFRTLALVSTVFLSFFGVYELDQYWNGGRGDSAGVNAMPSQSFGPSINWGGRR